MSGELGVLASLGLDAQLLTAGSLGGLAKGLADRASVWECTRLFLLGALVGNFFGVPAIDLAASGMLFGFKLTVGKGIAAFAVGGFSILIFSLITGWLSKRFAGKEQNG